MSDDLVCRHRYGQRTRVPHRRRGQRPKCTASAVPRSSRFGQTHGAADENVSGKHGCLRQRDKGQVSSNGVNNCRLRNRNLKISDALLLESRAKLIPERRIVSEVLSRLEFVV